MAHLRSSWKRWFAAVADLAFFGAICLAVAIERSGGIDWRFASFNVTASSGTRAAALALVVLVLRHVLVPRPSLPERLLSAWRRLGAFVRANPRVVAASLNIGALALVGAGIVADLLAPAHPDPETAPRWPPGLPFLGIAIVLWTVRRIAYGAVSGSIGAFQQWRARATSMTFAGATRRDWVLATAVLVVATGALMHEQLRYFMSVSDRGDPLLSIWRLGWIAHQLPRDPLHLFDANIFHPDLRTLAYSDAMLVPGLLAAPAIWLGAPLAGVYTALLLSTFIAGGLAMFALARAITTDTGSALIAALVFAFDPFKIAHYSHLELQFTCWMPLAVLFLLRTLVTGRMRDGTLTGVFVALQALSSLYYGAYLGVSLAVLGVIWMCLVARPTRRVIGALAAGGAIAVLAAALVTIPYRANQATIGERNPTEIRHYSAIGGDYFVANERSATYGAWLYDPHGAEHEMFTGVVPMVLAGAAFLRPIGPAVVPAALTLAASVDASLGLNGTFYSALNQLSPFHAFRVPARFRAVVGLYLALLAGLGVAALSRRVRSVRLRHTALVLIGVVLLAELRPVLTFEPLWARAPGIYALIPESDAVIADLPLPALGDLFWHDMIYMYFSTFHWRRLVNGTSGFSPKRYTELGYVARRFPADDALDEFRALGTQYFVLHEGFYRSDWPEIVRRADAQPRLRFVGASSWEEGKVRLYRLVR